MNFYDLVMRPLEKKILQRIRVELLSEANGETLEIGLGTGVNLKHYQWEQISNFTGLDVKISKEVHKHQLPKKIDLVQGRGEELPFKENSFDTVVATLLLCSVESVEDSLKEIKRVLKPGGKYLFIEHILPEEERLARTFQRVNGVWRNIAGGCNLNRKTLEILENSDLNLLKYQKTGKTILTYGVAIKEI